MGLEDWKVVSHARRLEIEGPTAKFHCRSPGRMEPFKGTRGSAAYAVYRVPRYRVSLRGVPRYRVLEAFAYRVPRSGTSIYRITTSWALRVPCYRVEMKQWNQQERNSK